MTEPPEPRLFKTGDSAWCWAPWAWLPRPFRIKILGCPAPHLGECYWRYTVRHPQHPNNPRMTIDMFESTLTPLSAVDLLAELAAP